ncbi:uncharacterized protein LOC142348217 isoform X2 [Convolutriloba macropyga]|uniref:uncharacterized protein LOC142348217 isoform X2 n=1 Tax=Convolutriloba macropyga TaxID=536237 RepID=UPI003F5215A4
MALDKMQLGKLSRHLFILLRGINWRQNIRYDSPAYETRDFLEGQCVMNCNRVPPLHPSSNPTPTPAGFANQSDCLNLQPLILSSTPQSCYGQNARIVHHSVQHSRNHSFGHSYYKDQPVLFQAEDPIQVDKLVYYPIITTDRSNTYVTYYPSTTHQQIEGSNPRDFALGHTNHYFDLNAHSNQVYEGTFNQKSESVNCSQNCSMVQHQQQNSYNQQNPALAHNIQAQNAQLAQNSQNGANSNNQHHHHNYHHSRKQQDRNQQQQLQQHQQQQQQPIYQSSKQISNAVNNQQNVYKHRSVSVDPTPSAKKLVPAQNQRREMLPNKTSSPVMFNEVQQNITSETEANKEHMQESMTSCNERQKVRSPKLTSSNESSDNVFHAGDAQTYVPGGSSVVAAGPTAATNNAVNTSGALNSTRESKTSRRSHHKSQNPSCSNQHRVLSLENSIAATNNHSVSSSPEHKSSGYATLDTANSLLVNQASPRPTTNQSQVFANQSNRSNFDVPSSTATYTPRSASANMLQTPPNQLLTSSGSKQSRQNRVPLNDLRKRNASSQRADSRQDSKCTQTYPELQISSKNSLVVPQSLPSTNPNFRPRKTSFSGTPVESPAPKSPVKSHHVKYYFDFSLGSVQPNYVQQNSSQQHSRQNTETYKILSNDTVETPPPVFAAENGATSTSKGQGRSAPASPILANKIIKHQSNNIAGAKSIQQNREHDYSTITSKHGHRVTIDNQVNYVHQNDMQKHRESRKVADNVGGNSFYRSFEQDLKKLNQFFDSQGASGSTLRQFRKRSRTNPPSELGSIPDVGDPRPEAGPGIISQQGLVENNFLNPPMTDFEKTLLVLNWLMECQKEIQLEKVCYF